MSKAIPIGPLAPEIYDTDLTEPSWWEATAPPAPARPNLTEDHQTEFAIIGGGFAGLAAARRLAELGRQAVVLEAGQIGWGASGRNGGIVCIGGHKLSEHALLRRFGAEEVARYYGLQVEGIHAVRSFCETEGLADFVHGDGEILFAHSPRMARALERETSQYGIEIEPIAPSQSNDITRHGGIRMRAGFGVHPLRLVQRLAECAERAGARLCPRSRVTAWRREGAAHHLVTPEGTVRADHVILATNGFTPDGLHRGFDGRAVPVLSNIAVTRPLTDEERGALPWLGLTPMSDTRHLLAYFRLLPEGRLLLGMRGDLRGSDKEREPMRAAVAQRISQAMPVLDDIEITHFWRGPVCANASLTPAVGRLPNDPRVGFAFGWHGSGINLAQIGGHLIAEVMAGHNSGEALIPAPMRGLPPRLPFPALRPLYVGAMKMLYGLQDRLS